MCGQVARQLLRFGMQRWRSVLLGVLLLSLGLPLPTHSDTTPCAVAARLRIDGLARVAYRSADQPSASRPLRDFPGEEAPVLSSVPPGATLTVLHGPVCERGVLWWEVQTLTGANGWTPETQIDSPSSGYALEPWQLLVDLTRPIPDGVTPTGLALIRVNEHGLARWLTAFSPRVLPNSGMDSFPGAEAGPLRQAFAVAQQACPDHAGWVDMPATNAVAGFPSPDSTRLLLVRHWWRAATQCDGSTTPRYGIDRLSVSDSNGERLLFDLPAHAALSGIPSDSITEADPPNQVVDVRWSPDNIHALAWLRYGDRARLLVIDTRDGALAFLDDGADPIWSPDGMRVNWLRADGPVTNLISDSPDRLITVGAARQTLALPATLQYGGAPLDPVWNADGTRLVACVRADSCASIAVIDVPLRRTLPTLTIPVGVSFGVRWVLGDSALLWLPRSGSTVIVQSINSGALRAFVLDLAAGERISDARPFPGGGSALIVVQTANGAARYSVLDLNSGALTTVTFAAP
ncbi:MAG: SH3 domain-containing protein [Aggregatilineales bacterium]